MSNKPMIARCPECGEKFKDPLLFVANQSMREHQAEAHPQPADPEHAAPESAPDQAGTTGTKNHVNGGGDE